MDKLSHATHEIEHILESLLREYGFDRKILEVKALAAWEHAVGKPVARHTRPISLVNGKLTVYTSNAVLITELSLLKRHVIEKINNAVGQSVVKDLQFFVKPVGSSQQKIQPRPRQNRLKKLDVVELHSEVLERIDQAVAEVEDPELKVCLKRLFITQSQRDSIDD